jgi:hypothetical protein
MTHARAKKVVLRALLVGGLALGVSGCLNINGTDLFLIQRTGQNKPFAILVNDSGTIACDNDSAQPLSKTMLLNARYLATALEDYVHAGGTGSAYPGKSLFRWRVELPDGTITFPDWAAKHQAAFAQIELFGLQAAQHVCHLSV